MGGLRRIPDFGLTAALGIALLLCPLASAQTTLGGEIRLQQEARSSGEGDGEGGESLTTASARLKIRHETGGWTLDFHYLLGLFVGDYRGGESGGQSLFDWQSETDDDGDGTAAHRIDRLSIGYAEGKTAVRIGRQAITWGRGAVFRPLDLFNPFFPGSIDTSYKPGADMAHFQRLLDNGGDWQLLFVPRRRRDDGGFSWGESAAAVKVYWPLGGVELEATAARDYGDAIAAFGASGPHGESLWGFDLVAHLRNSGGPAFSGVANYQASWSWGDRLASGFVEYYRNGFGVTAAPAADDLPDELEERHRRGQLLGEARDYLAVGGMVEWTPLLRLAPTAILNLNDNSGLLLLGADYSLADNLNLVAGVHVPMGSPRSEYGGRHLAGGKNRRVTPPRTFFLRLESYF